MDYTISFFRNTSSKNLSCLLGTSYLFFFSGALEYVPCISAGFFDVILWQFLIEHFLGCLSVQFPEFHLKYFFEKIVNIFQNSLRDVIKRFFLEFLSECSSGNVFLQDLFCDLSQTSSQNSCIYLSSIPPDYFRENILHIPLIFPQFFLHFLRYFLQDFTKNSPRYTSCDIFLAFFLEIAQASFLNSK